MEQSIDKSVMRIKELERQVDLLIAKISRGVDLEELVKSSDFDKIAVNSASKIDFISVEDIIYCKARLAYTEIFSLNDRVLTSTKSINEFEEQLSNKAFFRISKSLLININHVESFDKKKVKCL